jgi:hypothetical protein
MASNGKKATAAQASKWVRSAVRVPQFVALVTVDGAPFHIGLFNDAEEATEWTTDDSIRGLYTEFAGGKGDTPGHYVRMTLGVVAHDADPSLPSFLVSMTDMYQTWELGHRPADIPVMKTPNARAKAAEEEKANGGTGNGNAKKQAAPSGAKKSSTKKPSTAKPKSSTRKKSTSGTKTQAKKSASKKRTSSKKPTQRRRSTR